MIPPKGYRKVERSDIGAECIFTNIYHCGSNADCLAEDFITDTLSDYGENHWGNLEYTPSCGGEYSYCYIKIKPKNKPTPKTIELDPLLDSRLNNIDYMILQREIELNILRKLQESKCK